MGTDATLDPSTGEFAAQIPFFGFVATFEFDTDVSKTVLPINNLDISGQLVLEEGGASARVANGEMSGYITKEDGDMTEITLTPGGEPVSLTQIFKEGTLNYDSTAGMEVDTGDPSADAWFITGTYTAVPTDIDD
jgi:hypothetical protein